MFLPIRFTDRSKQNKRRNELRYSKRMHVWVSACAPFAKEVNKSFGGIVSYYLEVRQSASNLKVKGKTQGEASGKGRMALAKICWMGIK